MFTKYLKKEFYKFIYKKYSNLILFAKELILLFLLKKMDLYDFKKNINLIIMLEKKIMRKKVLTNLLKE